MGAFVKAVRSPQGIPDMLVRALRALGLRLVDVLLKPIHAREASHTTIIAAFACM